MNIMEPNEVMKYSINSIVKNKFKLGYWHYIYCISSILLVTGATLDNGTLVSRIYSTDNRMRAKFTK